MQSEKTERIRNSVSHYTAPLIRLDRSIGNDGVLSTACSS